MHLNIPLSNAGPRHVQKYAYSASNKHIIHRMNTFNEGVVHPNYAIKGQHPVMIAGLHKGLQSASQYHHQNG